MGFCLFVAGYILVMVRFLAGFSVLRKKKKKNTKTAIEYIYI